MAESLASGADVVADVFRFVKYLGGSEEGPIRSGASLTAGSLRCSMGAWGYSFFGTLQVPHLVTAGHCNRSLQHNQHDPFYFEKFEWNAGSADVQRMTPDGSFGEVSTDVRGGFSLINVVQAGGAFDIPNHPICKSGLTTGVTCGNIWSTSGGCRGHTNMRVADYHGADDDSGALVFSGTFPGVAIAGIHEGKCTIDLGGGPFDLRQYTFQSNALSVLGLVGWYTA